MSATLESRTAMWLLGLFSAGVYVFQFAPIVVVMLLSFNASRSGAFPMEGVSLQWYGKLFANESIHEAATAYLSARFEPAERDLQLTPFREIAFARKQIAEHDPVTPEQHPASSFDRAFMLNRGIGVENRPAARAVTWTQSSSTTLPGTALRIDQ